FRFALRGRGVQREWPSTLTNGQKPGKTFQIKIFHGCSIVLFVTRDTLAVSAYNTPYEWTNLRNGWNDRENRQRIFCRGKKLGNC
ncbi:MAG: hypothetical protein ACRD2B_05630, partial [Terriglobia bacterium]